MKQKILILVFLISTSLNTQAQNWVWAEQGSSGTDTIQNIGWRISSDNLGNGYVTGRLGYKAILGADTLYSNGTDILMVKYASNGNPLWAVKAGGPGFDEAYDIITDGDGNSYITGMFSDTAIFGQFSVESYGWWNGTTDMFIAKYDSNGNVLWVNRGGGSSTDRGRAVTIDDIGNVYVVGNYSGTPTFDTISLPNSISTYGSMFLAKYDNNGTLIWVKSALGTNGNQEYGICADNQGNCYITGTIGALTVIGNDTLNPQGNYEMFIAKYDFNGNPIWAKQSVGDTAPSIYTFGQHLVIDDLGNSYITGWFMSDTLNFDSIELYKKGVENIFIVKYDLNGNVVWAKNPDNGKNMSRGTGIAMDTSNNIYIVGYYNDTLTFDSLIINSLGVDLLSIKLNSDGTVLWIKTATGSSNIYGQGININLQGEINITGNFHNGNAIFDGNSLALSNFYDIHDIFTARLEEFIPTSIMKTPNATIKNIVCYPNPFSDITRLKFNTDKNSTYSLAISNLTGQILHKYNDVVSGHSIYARDFKCGFYIYTLFTDNVPIDTGKLIIER